MSVKGKLHTQRVRAFMASARSPVGLTGLFLVGLWVPMPMGAESMAKAEVLRARLDVRGGKAGRFAEPGARVRTGCTDCVRWWW